MNPPVYQLIILALTCWIQLSSSLLWCYYCSDDPFDPNPHRPFDTACGKYNYQGSESDVSSFFSTCAVLIRDDGYVYRGPGGANYIDGQCGYYTDGTECYCEGNRCNTNSFCSQCGYPKPTPTGVSTPSTSDVSTSSTAVGTTMLSSSVPTPSTTKGTTLVTSKGSLQCYYCISCSDVDDSTPVIEDDGFLACMTTVFLNSKEVIRGGSRDEYGFDECWLHNEILTCVCLSDHCNDDTFAQLL